MRSLIIALGLVVLVSDAFAADYETPVLRGSSPYVAAPPSYTRWSGAYAGAHAGYGFSNMDFTGVRAFGPTDPFTAPYLGPASAWAQFGTDNPRAASYGGFIGYNAQWDDVILGVELNYNRTSLFGQSSATRCYSASNASCAAGAIALGDTNSYNVTIDTAASMKITDYGTARMRAGWAYQNFLPYASVGFALARAQANRVTTVSGTPVPNGAGTAFVSTDSESLSPILYGYSAGAGIDVLLLPMVFLRAEYEFVQFITATSRKANLNSVRGGLGIRF